MKVEIDVRKPDGTTLSAASAGPITSAVRGQVVQRLDAAGTVSFEMPAADEMTQYLQHEHRFRVRGYRDGGSVELGTGIVRDRRVQVQGGPELLQIKGPDIGDELNDRLIPRLDLFEDAWEKPKRVLVLTPDGGGIYSATDITAAVTDGNPATYATVQFVASGNPTYLYVGAEWPVGADSFVLGTQKNGVGATFKGQNYRGEADKEWQALRADPLDETSHPTDGTAVAGAPLAQDGAVAWEIPGAWQRVGVEGSALFWHRLYVEGVILSHVDINAITVKVRKPTTTDLAQIMAKAPSGWALHPDGAQGTVRGTYVTVAGETVLGALNLIKKLSGEHFRIDLGPNEEKYVRWLGPASSAPPPSLRAIQAPHDPVAVRANDDVVLLASAKIISESHDIVSRVQPFGAGNAAARVTLEHLSDGFIVPGGYTLDRANNWLKRDATETQFGQKERQKEFPEVSGVDASAASDAAAAEQLFWAAKAWLDRKSGPLVAYEAKVVKVPSGAALAPGNLLHAVYRAVRKGYVYIDIDTVVTGQPLYIWEVTWGWTERGLEPTGIKFATSDQWPPTEKTLLVEVAREVRAARAHAQPLAAALVRPTRTTAGI
jgi:hypothetical protein